MELCGMQYRILQVDPGPLVQRVRHLQLEQWLANVKTEFPVLSCRRARSMVGQQRAGQEHRDN